MELKIVNIKNDVIANFEKEDYCALLHTCEYEQGDKIVLETDKSPCYCVVQFEDTLPPQLIYITEPEIKYAIPFDSDRIVFSQKCFAGNAHAIRARYAKEEEISAYQNLALNVYDRHGDNNYFPHAHANVETRGEAVFAAYNAIDGVFDNNNHGAYPYQSWGINRDPNATITINFGREINIKEIALTLRADFPHDSYWTKATLVFSDESSMALDLIKSELPQKFTAVKGNIEWVRLEQLIKADDESPFPALTQLEVYGYNSIK